MQCELLCEGQEDPAHGHVRLYRFVQQGLCSRVWIAGLQQVARAQVREPHLPGLLKMLLWAQSRLDERCDYPRSPSPFSPRSQVTPTCALPVRCVAFVNLRDGPWSHCAVNMRPFVQ